MSMDNIVLPTQRSRKLVTRQSKPALYPHVRLRYEPVRGAYALLSPEKVFWPNDIGLEIINLCDSNKTVEDIATLLADIYDAPIADVYSDVESFIQEWADQLLVQL